MICAYNVLAIKLYFYYIMTTVLYSLSLMFVLRPILRPRLRQRLLTRFTIGRGTGVAIHDVT